MIVYTTCAERIRSSRHVRDVFGQDHHVSQFAGCERALAIVLEGRVGGIERVGPQSLLGGHPLFRKKRVAGGRLARHAGIEAAQRIDILDLRRPCRWR